MLGSLLAATLFLNGMQKTGSAFGSVIFLAFVFTGVGGGYATARFLKIFKESRWLQASLMTAFIFPSLVFVFYCFLDFCLSLEHSSLHMGIFKVVALLFVWVCCSTPLVLIGAFFGISSKPVKLPCKVNVVPSSIPRKPWYMGTKYLIWIAGVIPFM
jgi:transmembrane 9 superfamily protein 2/4